MNNSRTAILGSFVAACAIITWRDIKNPDSSWPLPVPPPYRYAGAGVAFGLLGLVGAFFNEKLAGVLAVGLVIGLGFQTAQQGISNGGSSGGTPTNIPGNTGSGKILGHLPVNQGGSAIGSPISNTDKV